MGRLRRRRAEPQQPPAVPAATPTPADSPITEEAARAAELAAFNALTGVDRLRDQVAEARSSRAAREEVAALEQALSSATSVADDLLERAVSARIAADDTPGAPASADVADDPAPTVSPPPPGVDFTAALSNAIGESGADVDGAPEPR